MVISPLATLRPIPQTVNSPDLIRAFVIVTLASFQ